MNTGARLARNVLLICGVYLIMNFAYAAKSLVGIDLLPGHHGNLFPLGDWIFESLKHRAPKTHAPINGRGPEITIIWGPERASSILTLI